MFSDLREWFCKPDATTLQHQYNQNASGPAQSSTLVKEESKPFVGSSPSGPSDATLDRYAREADLFNNNSSGNLGL